MPVNPAVLRILAQILKKNPPGPVFPAGRFSGHGNIPKSPRLSSTPYAIPPLQPQSHHVSSERNQITGAGDSAAPDRSLTTESQVRQRRARLTSDSAGDGEGKNSFSNK